MVRERESEIRLWIERKMYIVQRAMKERVKERNKES